MRPTVMPHPLTPRWLALVAVAALAAAPLAARAHSDTPHAPIAASADAVEMTGRLETITVIDRLNATSNRYSMLVMPDAPRYRLDNASTAATGVTVTVRGRVTGRTIAVESIRAAAQAPSPRAAQARNSLVGTVRVFHMDYPDGTSEFGYELFGDNGQRNVIDIGTPLPGVANGARASIAGNVDASGYITVDTIEILAPPARSTIQPAQTNVGTSAVKTTSYMVFPVKFPNETSGTTFTYPADPFTVASITTSVFGASPTKSVAEYYKEVSFGAQLLNGVVANAAGAWLLANVPRPTLCGSSDLNAVLNAIQTSGNAAAVAAGFTPGNYAGHFYVANALPCGWSGLGYIGIPLGFSKGTASLLVVGHEMGHNFGLLHAGSVNCGVNVIAASGCSVAEYGDPYVMMGNQRAGHFNANQKNILGYIPGGVSTHSSGTATYTLGPIESPGQPKYAVQVPTSNAKRTYWVEFRQSIGFDAGFPNITALGAQLRLGGGTFETSSGSDDTQYLDLSPNGNFTDTALLAGQTFSDSSTGISIQVVNATSSAIDVKVTAPGGGPAATTTTLASSANPSTQGQSVTFTASVTGTSPTGSVTLKDGGTVISGCSVVALTGSGNTRTAPCATAALGPGVHSITADYAGDAANASSSSSALSQTVKAASTTALASSLNPSTSGASVTFTATIVGTGPTGSVAFTSDGAGISGCGAQTVSGSGNSRTATCSTAALATGTHAIIASYGGDGLNVGSANAALSQVVNVSGPAPTTTSLGSSQNPSPAGGSVTFTATVNGNAPSGGVAFTSDGASISGCTAVSLSGSGNSRTAACTTSTLAAGAHSIVASYAGNASNAASSSAPLSQSVNAANLAATTTTVSSTLNPSSATGTVALTATVDGNPVVSAGTVAFTANGAPIAACGAVAVTGAHKAVCTTGLGSGAWSIVATYSGDAAHQASVSKVYSQVVSLQGIGNQFAFFTSSSAVSESAGSAIITVLRIGDATSPASVNYATLGGSAIANADFTPSNGTLVWNANDTAPRTITVPIASDGLSESSETFSIVLTNPIGASIATATQPVTIFDDESLQLPMPGVANVTRNDLGALSVIGGTLNATTISNLGNNSIIQLGTVAGSAGAFVELDFQGLDVGAGNTIVVRSGAANQTVVLKNVNANASVVAGSWQAQGGNGALPPHVIVQSAAGLTVNPGGRIIAPAGLDIVTIGGAVDGTLTNNGVIDGGTSLRIDAGSVHGTGRMHGDAIDIANTAFLNMPQFGMHYESNALHLYPSTGNTLRVGLANYGSASQVVNLMLHGNATLSMPSVWPGGSTMPANNRPAMAGEVRPAGAPDPVYGGGSMIVRSTGTLTLDGGASGDFVFAGGISFISDGVLDLNGTAIDNGWTTSGATYQGVFMQAPSIVDNASANGISVRTNNLNWVNFSVRPAVPVHTWTLQKQGDGTTAFSVADAIAPHLNFYSLVSEAGAAGLCYVCLVNPQVIDFSSAP